MQQAPAVPRDLPHLGQTHRHVHAPYVTCHIFPGKPCHLQRQQRILNVLLNVQLGEAGKLILIVGHEAGLCIVTVNENQLLDSESAQTVVLLSVGEIDRNQLQALEPCEGGNFAQIDIVLGLLTVLKDKGVQRGGCQLQDSQISIY